MYLTFQYILLIFGRNITYKGIPLCTSWYIFIKGGEKIVKESGIIALKGGVGKSTLR